MLILLATLRVVRFFFNNKLLNYILSYFHLYQETIAVAMLRKLLRIYRGHFNKRTLVFLINQFFLLLFLVFRKQSQY